MQNRGMERSAAYSGIVGAILFIISGVLPGMLPPVTASSTAMSTFISGHAFALSLSAWLAVPAVGFVLWFAYGLFDYLRDPQDRDRSLGQWGRGGAVVWATIYLVGSALPAAAVIRLTSATASLPTLYVFSGTLFAFSMGAFAAFAFGAAHEARRRNAMPGWLNAFGYLVFLVDLAYTVTIFSSSVAWSVMGYGAIVSPLLSAIWIFVASIVLLVSIPKTAAARV